ncbi:MAG TPA: hypothetical protein VH987_05550 [Candidatus Limnocylindria bacterium]|jgi:hypothetical protein
MTGLRVALGVACITLASCGGGAAQAAPPAPAVEVEEEGDGRVTLVLTEDAAERLALETSLVPSAAPHGVPESAVVYDAAGHAWIYLERASLTYAREAVEVVEVAAGTAVLAHGPPANSRVVVVGAMELYGAETGIGGDH